MQKKGLDVKTHCLFFYLMVCLQVSQIQTSQFGKGPKNPLTLSELKKRALALFEQCEIDGIDLHYARVFPGSVVKQVNTQISNGITPPVDCLIVESINVIKKQHSAAIKEFDTGRKKRDSQSLHAQTKAGEQLCFNGEIRWGNARLRPLKDGKWVEQNERT